MVGYEIEMAEVNATMPKKIERPSYKDRREKPVRESLKPFVMLWIEKNRYSFAVQQIDVCNIAEV